MTNNPFSLAVLRNDLEESFSGKISKLSTQILNLAGTIIAVIVDSLCDPISLVRSVSLAYSALNPLYVASLASPSSSVSYPGVFSFLQIYRYIVIVFVNVGSLCDRISLVRLVSLGYSALNPLYVASFASPSSSVSYPGARK